jgi:hypothetical protein
MLRMKGTKSYSKDFGGTHWKLEEHVKNLLRTLTEHSGNTLRKKEIQHSHLPPNEKKLGTLSACYFTSLARRIFLVLCPFWPRLMARAWIMGVYVCFPIDYLGCFSGLKKLKLQCTSLIGLSQENFGDSHNKKKFTSSI